MPFGERKSFLKNAFNGKGALILVNHLILLKIKMYLSGCQPVFPSKIVDKTGVGGGEVKMDTGFGF